MINYAVQINKSDAALGLYLLLVSRSFLWCIIGSFTNTALITIIQSMISVKKFPSAVVVASFRDAVTASAKGNGFFSTHFTKYSVLTQMRPYD